MHDCNEKDFDKNDICPLNKNSNYRSLAFESGTCVEMNDTKESVWITADNNDLGKSYKGGYAKKCETYNQPLRCPHGTFVKELEWDSKFDLTKGIKLSCYSPEFYNSNVTILESHPGALFELSDKRKCAAITGITFKIDYKKDSIVELDLKKNFTVGYSKGIRSFCDTRTALSGIDFVIEKKSKLCNQPF